MAKQLKDVLSSTRNLAFNNGTNIDVGPFVGQITQWTNEHSGARLTYRVSADEDTSFALRRAFEELGIQEQETICLDVVSAAPTRGYTSSSEADRVVLRPAKDSAQVVLYHAG